MKGEEGWRGERGGRKSAPPALSDRGRSVGEVEAEEGKEEEGEEMKQ